MTKFYILAGIAALVVVILKSPWFKGWLGELQVNLVTMLFLRKDNYHLIKNVTIPAEGGTTQIDHVLVSQFGVFAVETKNLSGWIFGKEQDGYWTQKLYRHTAKFQNPLRQNYKHTKGLSEMLGISDDKIHSVVVFPGETTFKTQMPENVTRLRGYIRYIRSKTKPLLTEGEVKRIIKIIGEKRMPVGVKTNFQHVDHVKNIKAGRSRLM